MFSPSITLTESAIDSIKAELAKTLSNVKSSHRVEALARGLGFSTNAALRAEIAKGKYCSAVLTWDRVVPYLKEHGFQAEAKPFYVALGREAIRQILSLDKDITVYGCSIEPRKKKEDGSWESREEYDRRYAEARKELEGDRCVEQFLRSVDLVGPFKKLKNINKKSDSYGLKHFAERRPCSYPDGTFLGPEYVSNGALIAAAINAGFQYEPFDQLNASFNMAEKDISVAREEDERNKMAERNAA